MFFTILILVYLMLLGIVDIILLKDIQHLKKHSHYHHYNVHDDEFVVKSFPTQEVD